MRHHSPLSPFHLTPYEVKQFLQLAQAHRSPQAIARRARIVLTAHAHPTWNSKQIAKSLDVNDRLVRKWRRRWQETHSLTTTILKLAEAAVLARSSHAPYDEGLL